jgi:U4/U6.U5 tri-snRNP-associated protein 1
VALSVEETNKLRASLGMKPLKVTEDTAAAPAEEGKQLPGTSTIENDVLVQGTVPGEKKKTDAFKEKLAVRKEKRGQEAKLAKVVTLGEQGDEDDSAAAWIKKSRAIAKAKKEAAVKAAAKAAELAQMDEDAEETNKQLLPSYTSSDLAGLTVRHDEVGIFLLDVNSTVVFARGMNRGGARVLLRTQSPPTPYHLGLLLRFN